MNTIDRLNYDLLDAAIESIRHIIKAGDGCPELRLVLESLQAVMAALKPAPPTSGAI